MKKYDWREAARRAEQCNKNAREGERWMRAQQNYLVNTGKKGKEQEQDNKNKPSESGLEL